MMMRKLINCGLIVTAALAQVFVLQFDYYIHVGDCYAIFNHPNHQNHAVIQFIKPTGIDFPLIADVTAFAMSGNTVVGTTKRGFFVADEAGKMVEYSNLHSWHAACKNHAVDDATSRFVRVSRFDDPALWRVQIGIIGVVVMLLLLNSCAYLLRRPNNGTELSQRPN